MLWKIGEEHQEIQFIIGTKTMPKVKIGKCRCEPTVKV
jgi:hypothetical protein